MNLNVIRYRNYVYMMPVNNGSDLYHSKTYYFFYELNNGEVIYFLSLALYNNTLKKS